MTWVPPFFTCGECGGEIGRWPITNMLRQEVLDWKHRTVPDDPATGRPVEPHRAILGTPGPRVALMPGLSTPVEVADGPVPTPPPEVPARPALAGDLPPAAARLDRKAELAGWTVEAWFMRGPLLTARAGPPRMISSVSLRLERDGHRVFACWDTKPWKGTPYSLDYLEWSFDMAWSSTHELRVISSPELNKIVSMPRMLCEDCNEPPALHVSTETGPVCYSMQHPTPTTPEVLLS